MESYDIMDHWEFVDKYLDDIYKLGHRMCRGRHDLVDELVSDMVAERVPNIFETWDPCFDVPPEKHAWINLRRYMWKWMNRRMRKEVVNREPLFEDSLEDHRVQDIVLDDAVKDILERLSAEDAAALSLYHLCDMTFREMSDVYDCGKGRARKTYMRAKQNAEALILQDKWSQCLERLGIAEAIREACLPAMRGTC